jgi:hypothetical protein
MRDWAQGLCRRDLRTHETLFCGAFSSMFASLLMFPVDLLRRQMQMNGVHGYRFRYTGTLHAAKSIYARGGITAFYSGLPAELLKVTPNMAITFCVYEYWKQFFARTA